MHTILTVDDDPRIRESLKSVLEGDGVTILEAPGVAAARSLLATSTIDLVLLDVFLGDEDGLTLLDELRRDHPAVPVVMISGESDIPIALRAIRAGAWDFLEKPLGRSKLKVTVRNALAASARTRENEEARVAQLGRWTFTGESAPIRDVDRILGKAAESTISVLITGENGTGKEIAAHRLHHGSARWSRPFVKINCASIPAELLESELFGHARGAFTGAMADRRGLFLEANGGTIFLDEIGDMATALQAKLLRVLEQREVTRVGEATARSIDVRVISATNHDVHGLVRDGRFRQDLYFRLAGLEVRLPALRERPEDVPALVALFVERFCFENNLCIPEIAPEALREVSRFAFPGNVRELKNIVERTVLLAEGDVVRAFHLAPPVTFEGADEVVEGSLVTVKRELMRRHIRRRLRVLGGDKRKLAAELDVHPNNLRRLLRDYGVESSRPDASRDPGSTDFDARRSEARGERGGGTGDG